LRFFGQAAALFVEDEIVLLGNAAFRAGVKLEGCSSGRVDGNEQAAPFLGVPYRDGWAL
jgi:hypothetical protein